MTDQSVEERISRLNTTTEGFYFDKKYEELVWNETERLEVAKLHANRITVLKYNSPAIRKEIRQIVGTKENPSAQGLSAFHLLSNELGHPNYTDLVLAKPNDNTSSTDHRKAFYDEKIDSFLDQLVEVLFHRLVDFCEINHTTNDLLMIRMNSAPFYNICRDKGNTTTGKVIITKELIDRTATVLIPLGYTLDKVEQHRIPNIQHQLAVLLKYFHLPLMSVYLGIREVEKKIILNNKELKQPETTPKKK